MIENSSLFVAGVLLLFGLGIALGVLIADDIREWWRNS